MNEMINNNVCPDCLSSIFTKLILGFYNLVMSGSSAIFEDKRYFWIPEAGRVHELEWLREERKTKLPKNHHRQISDISCSCVCTLPNGQCPYRACALPHRLVHTLNSTPWSTHTTFVASTVAPKYNRRTLLVIDNISRSLYAIRGQFKNYLLRTRWLSYVCPHSFGSFQTNLLSGSFPISIVNFIFGFFSDTSQSNESDETARFYPCFPITRKFQWERCLHKLYIT